MVYGWETNRTDSLSGFIFNSCQCVSLNEDDYGFQGSQVACSNSKATGFVWLFSTVRFQISVWLNEDDNLNDLEKGFQGSQVARSNSKVTAKGRRRSISYPNLLQIYAVYPHLSQIFHPSYKYASLHSGLKHSHLSFHYLPKFYPYSYRSFHFLPKHSHLFAKSNFIPFLAAPQQKYLGLRSSSAHTCWAPPWLMKEKNNARLN